MTRERATIMALEIVDTCRTYGNEDRCRQCPFNITGCIVTDGNNIPTDWIIADFISLLERKGEK